MSVSAVEDALLIWVKRASGFDDEHAFFNDQKVERPAGPYATLKIMSVIPVGAVDSLTTNYDAGRSAGVEIEQRVDGLREVSVSVSVYGAPVTDPSALSAVALAHKIHLGIRLPSIRDALDDAGASPFNLGAVQNLAALLGTAFDGRAQFDASFYVVESASEFTTYISTVTGTDGIVGRPFTITAP